MQTTGYTQEQEDHIRLSKRALHSSGKKKIWTDENQAGGGSGTTHDPKHTRHYLLNIVEAMLWFVHVHLPIETS